MSERANKYRVWDEESETMYYSDKEYDDCFFGFDGGVVVAWFRKTVPQTLDEPAYDVGEPILQSRWHSTKDVMQFTGRLDKNGKEIYEGDRVLGGDAKTVSEVYWRNGGFGIRNEFTEADPDSITFINLETCEIIGTKFDTPDQSKKEK